MAEHRADALRKSCDRLRLLLHAQQCTAVTCAVPRCREAGQVLAHALSCNDGDSCANEHCYSTKELLTHASSCKNRACAVCGPLREERTAADSSAAAGGAAAATAATGSGGGGARGSGHLRSDDIDTSGAAAAVFAARALLVPVAAMPVPGDRAGGGWEALAHEMNRSDEKMRHSMNEVLRHRKDVNALLARATRAAGAAEAETARVEAAKAQVDVTAAVQQQRCAAAEQQLLQQRAAAEAQLKRELAQQRVKHLQAADAQMANLNQELLVLQQLRVTEKESAEQQQGEHLRESEAANKRVTSLKQQLQQQHAEAEAKLEREQEEHLKQRQAADAQVAKLNQQLLLEREAAVAKLEHELAQQQQEHRKQVEAVLGTVREGILGHAGGCAGELQASQSGARQGAGTSASHTASHAAGGDLVAPPPLVPNSPESAGSGNNGDAAPSTPSAVVARAAASSSSVTPQRSAYDVGGAWVTITNDGTKYTYTWNMGRDGCVTGVLHTSESVDGVVNDMEDAAVSGTVRGTTIRWAPIGGTIRCEGRLVQRGGASAGGAALALAIEDGQCYEQIADGSEQLCGTFSGSSRASVVLSRSRHGRTCCLCQKSGTFEPRNYEGREYVICGTCECSKCGHAHHTSQGQFVPVCARFAQEQACKRAAEADVDECRSDAKRLRARASSSTSRETVVESGMAISADSTRISDSQESDLTDIEF